MRSQFLFGYDRGHTLIAGSERLSKRLEAVLTRQSDAAAGVTLHDDTHYWSGVPIDDGRYALTSTWSAPEMPRPGCVWSHVILLTKDDLTSIPSLQVLMQGFRRPKSRSDTSWAREGTVLPDPGVNGPEAEPTPGALEILRAVYGQGTLGRASYHGSDRHRCTFDIWSQQWAELRGTFSFVTALQEVRTSSHSNPPDLSFHRMSRAEPSTEAVESWIVALRDAIKLNHPLRALLSRAGPDLPPEPSSVRIVARLFAFTHGSKRNEGSKALRFAAKEYPKPEDAAALKAWLIRTILSEVPIHELYDFVRYVSQDPGAVAFPNIHRRMSIHLGRLWADSVTRTFDLAALRFRSAGRADDLFLSFARTAPLDALTTLPETDDWDVKAAFICDRPDLLSGAILDTAPISAISEIVKCIPKISLVQLDLIVGAILIRPISDEGITAMQRIGSEGLVRYIDALVDGDGGSIHRSWRTDRDLSKKSVEQVLREQRPAETLLHIVSRLGLEIDVLHQVDQLLLRKYLSKSRKGRVTTAAEVLHARILASALRGRTSYEVKLIRDIAIWLWRRMKDRTINDRAEQIVMEQVPYYFLVPPWDHCMRLMVRLRGILRDQYHSPDEWVRVERILGMGGDISDEMDEMKE